MRERANVALPLGLRPPNPRRPALRATVRASVRAGGGVRV